MKYLKELIAVTLLSALACGTSGGDSDQDKDPAMGPARAEHVPTGSIEIRGRVYEPSETVYTFEGPSTTQSGRPVVRCDYFPAGSDRRGTPELKILAGFAQEEPSVALTLRGSATEPGTHSLFDAVAGNPTIALRSRLSFDDPEEFWEYEIPGSDSADADCLVELQDRSVYTSGVVSCRDLVPTSRSLDAGIDSARASITLDFQCPIEGTPSGEPTPDPASGGTGPVVVDPGGGGPATGGNSSGGTTSGGGSCEGSATPCLILGEFECREALGCQWDEDCEGVASSCYSQFNSFSCYGLDGCFWSSLNDNCSGISRSCSSFAGSSSCRGQQGCRWKEDCTGVAVSCSTFSSENSCEDQPGCRWEDSL